MIVQTWHIEVAHKFKWHKYITTLNEIQVSRLKKLYKVKETQEVVVEETIEEKEVEL